MSPNPISNMRKIFNIIIPHRFTFYHFTYERLSFLPIGHFVSSCYVLVTFAINDYDIDILQNLNGVL